MTDLNDIQSHNLASRIFGLNKVHHFLCGSTRSEISRILYPVPPRHPGTAIDIVRLSHRPHPPHVPKPHPVLSHTKAFCQPSFVISTCPQSTSSSAISDATIYLNLLKNSISLRIGKVMIELQGVENRWRYSP